MSIPGTWEEAELTISFAPQAWTVASARDGFAPNVNVFVETTPAMSLQAYVDASVVNAPKLVASAEVHANGVIERDGRADAGFIDYTFGQAGIDLEAVAYVVRLPGGFAVATFIAPRDRFDELLAQVEPYLATLDEAG